MVKQKQAEALTFGADEMTRGDTPLGEEDLSSESYDRLLLRSAFAAWKPGGQLSTSNILKSSIARILMRTEQAAARQPAAPKVERPQSAKLQGITAPAVFEPQPDTMVDAMDGYFKWYASTVVRVSNKRALIKFGDWPERFNEWIAFESGRMATLATFTNGIMTNRM